VTRAVFDANVLVSGFANTSGTPAVLVDHWLAQHFELVVSEVILAEMERAWTKPYWTSRFTSEKIQQTLTRLHLAAEMIPISAAVRGVATHPEDDLILATAVSANADFLVTGDKQLLTIGYYEGTRIVSPRDFLTILEQTEA
jgi:putative PIN family toxin of toxin-antitoxin system